MKLELYKPYRTRGGWKAVVVRKTAHHFVAHHSRNDEVLRHTDQGIDCGYQSDENSDLIEEWKEPRTFDVWVNAHELHSGVVSFSTNPDGRTGENVIATKKITLTEGDLK